MGQHLVLTCGYFMMVIMRHQISCSSFWPFGFIPPMLPYMLFPLKRCSLQVLVIQVYLQFPVVPGFTELLLHIKIDISPYIATNTRS